MEYSPRSALYHRSARRLQPCPSRCRGVGGTARRASGVAGLSARCVGAPQGVLTRQCNSTQPCSECVAMGAECQWRVPPPGPRKSTSPPSKKRLTNGTPKVSNGGPARPGNVGASERGIPSSELLLQHPACIDALLTLWFRELDWMYDICRGTMLERLWRERGAAALIDDRHRDKFAFLVLAISAITCQMAPGDASTVFFTAGWNIGLDQLELMADACFRAADGRIEQLLSLIHI